MKSLRKLILLSICVLMIESCQLDDERDDCCYLVQLHFTELQYGTDHFYENVRTLRHFLFDADGYFLREIPSNWADRANLTLNDLEDGDYTMVTLCNATEQRTQLTPGDRLEDFTLLLSSQKTNRNTAAADDYGNSDELYWQIQPFSAKSNEMRNYECDLSNIHCHLHLLVTWKTLPRTRGDYTLRLTGVPCDYLPGLAGYSTAYKTFPQEQRRLVTHSETEQAYNFEVEFELVTHRYTDDRIPEMQLWNNGQAITQVVDLQRAFLFWGWQPERMDIQEYWIKMVIHDNGDIELQRWGRGQVLDWIDGGTVM